MHTRNDFCQNLQPSKPRGASCLPILGLSPCLASPAPIPQDGQDIPRAILVARPAGRRLGKALPEPKLETRAQAPIHPKRSSPHSAVASKNHNRSFESFQAFSGRQGPTLCKITKTPSSPFRIERVQTLGDLYHLAVPPLIREGRVKSETPSDYLISLPKSLKLLSEQGSGPCGAGRAWMEIRSIQEPARFRPCKGIHIAPHCAPRQRRVPAEGRGG